MELHAHVKNYSWGRRGKRSYVAHLAKANNPAMAIDDSQHYAELWIGDHVNGPATLKSNGMSLSDVIRKNPTGMVGGNHAQLPFLLKVLSIGDALSLQLHPDKAEAEKLHEQFPLIYKDPNHKPELAIALNDFQALCGFQPVGEIKNTVYETAALRDLLGEGITDQIFERSDIASVKAAFEHVMRSDQAAIAVCLRSIAEDANKVRPDNLRDLFLRLYKNFGADVGVLSVFFLNHIELEAGEAIYLPANVPHAYLQGECVECMACSDNVVRAGLTPKFIDVDTLLRLVSYNCSPPESMLFEPKVLHEDEQPYTRTFIPPVNDFAVSEIKLPAGVREYTLFNPVTGSVLLVLNGEARLLIAEGEPIELTIGTVCFLPSKHSGKILLEVDNTGREFLAFQAMANDFLAIDEQ